MKHRSPAIALAFALAASTAAAIPPGDPPTFTPPGSVAPPVGWLETARGDHWVYPTDWEWCPPALGGSCAMEPQAALVPGGLCFLHLFPYREEAVARAGERVRFHLGFTPDTTTLAFGGSIEPLPAGQVVPWTAAGRSGALVLRVQAGRTVVDYRIRLVVGSDATAPRVVPVGVFRREGRVFLRVRSSEPVTTTGCLSAAGRGDATMLRRFDSRNRIATVAVARGTGVVPLGRLPQGRIAARLRVRDAVGNTTVLDVRVNVGPGEVALLR